MPCLWQARTLRQRLLEESSTGRRPAEPSRSIKFVYRTDWWWSWQYYYIICEDGTCAEVFDLTTPRTAADSERHPWRIQLVRLAENFERSEPLADAEEEEVFYMSALNQQFERLEEFLSLHWTYNRWRLRRPPST